VAGGQAYNEFEVSTFNYAANQLILIVDINADPIFSKGNTVAEINYTGTVLLGRKFETTTVSTLDEKFLQKYDRRLLSLMSSLMALLKSVACTNELTLTKATTKLEINKFDENIDFVSAEIQILQ
jgi:hypothetical protein